MTAWLDAAAPLFAPAFTLWGAPVARIEIAAFALAVWMVFCNMRVDPLGWPLAIVSSALYALLFASSRLYGEASLQIVFVVVAAWGWRQWLRGRQEKALAAVDRSDEKALRVHRLSGRGRLVAAVSVAAGWPVVALALARFTDSDLPWLDALPTTASLAGQVLLGRKAIENWPVWFAVNLVSTALFAAKGLWLTVALYALFAALSVAGWRAWLAIEGRTHA